MSHFGLSICIPASFETALVLCFFLQQVHFAGILFLALPTFGQWLDCDAFVLVFKTAAAARPGGCDPLTCVSDRKERSLLRGFTVN